METEYKTFKRRAKRVTRVLHSHGMYTRQDVLGMFDKDADLEAIDGIGPTLEKTLRALLQLTDEEWDRVTGMAN